MDDSEERAEVAARLREKAQERFYPGSFSFGVMDSDCWTALLKALRVGNNYQTVMEYIAELIDPTCEFMYRGVADAYGRHVIHLGCGHSFVWYDGNEKPAYCPVCGARIARKAPRRD